MDHNNGAGPQGKQYPSQLFGSRFKSKRDCHRFLTVEVGAYLPPFEVVTIYHLRELISGVKKVCFFNFTISKFIKRYFIKFFIQITRFVLLIPP